MVFTHPLPTFDVSSLPLITDSTSGETNCYDLPGAIALYPFGNVTFLCKATSHPYARATIESISHVHFLGNPLGGTIFRGLSVNNSSEQGYPNSGTFWTNLKLLDSLEISLLNNPHKDFYFQYITFDANGRIPQVDNRGTPDYVTLATNGIRDVLCDNCIFQNCGLKSGIGGNWHHLGVTNVWYRNCAFHGSGGSIVANPNSTFTFDGAAASGLLDCTIDGFYTDNNEWQDDEDSTVDQNADGILDLIDMHDTKYCVISGLNSSGGRGFILDGYNQLFENCHESTNVTEWIIYKSRSLDDWSCTGPGLYTSSGYKGTGSVFRDNHVRSMNTSFLRAELTFLNASSVIGKGTNTLGQFVIENTLMDFASTLVTYYQPNPPNIPLATPLTILNNTNNDIVQVLS